MSMRVAAGLALLGVAIVFAGCEAADDSGPSTTTAELAAKDRLPPIQHDLGPRHYRRLVAGTLQLLAEYWGNQLPDLGAEPRPPKELISYWNRRQDVGCRGRPAGPANAQYCAATKTISWDGTWLYGDLYRHVGDAAVMFLLAHEYGHLVQDQLGVDRKFGLTIEAELNADCLAGAWLGTVNTKLARLRRADYESLYAGVLDVADPQGLPWQNPSAHGTAAERRRALNLGARRGQRTCLRRLGPGFTR